MVDASVEFSETFDKVPHGGLVLKVASHGIQGELAELVWRWESEGGGKGFFSRLEACNKWRTVGIVAETSIVHYLY